MTTPRGIEPRSPDRQSGIINHYTIASVNFQKLDCFYVVKKYNKMKLVNKKLFLEEPRNFKNPAGEKKVMKEVITKIKNITNNLIVVDCGANKGLWTENVLDIVNECDHIICFEVVPFTFQKLKEKHDGNDKVILFNKGVSDSETDIEITDCLDCNTGFSLITKTGFKPKSKARKKEKIQTVRLDKILPSLFPDQIIGFIKIDVEGYELPTLKGLKQLLEETKVVSIQWERHKIWAKESLFLEVKYLQDYGFQSYIIGINGLVRVDGEYWDQIFDTKVAVGRPKCMNLLAIHSQYVNQLIE